MSMPKGKTMMTETLKSQDEQPLRVLSSFSHLLALYRGPYHLPFEIPHGSIKSTAYRAFCVQGISVAFVWDTNR
jgi:hypothetical protein